MICFQISIFTSLETAPSKILPFSALLWFAFKLVSLHRWKQLERQEHQDHQVVICFQISIFTSLETAMGKDENNNDKLWFAFKLVSLHRWKQQFLTYCQGVPVVICFQISIFTSLETAPILNGTVENRLWFAFKLVSLHRWKQPEKVNLIQLWCCDLLSN